MAMSLVTAELPEDIAALRAFALACQGELKAAQLAVQVKGKRCSAAILPIRNGM